MSGKKGELVNVGAYTVILGFQLFVFKDISFLPISAYFPLPPGTATHFDVTTYNYYQVSSSEDTNNTRDYFQVSSSEDTNNTRDYCQVSSSEDTNNTRDTSSDLKTSSTDTLDLPDILLDNLENKDTSNTDHSSRESLTRHALTRQDSVFSNQTKDDVDEINLIDDEDDDLTKSNHVLSKDINSSSDHTDDISKSDGVSLVYGVSNVDEVSNISSIDNIANLGSISRADSISRLEEELETWESFYKSNREMFEMIRKWKELNERYVLI